MSGEPVEPFSIEPDLCPKCGGESRIDCYALGAPSRDHAGQFSAFRHGPNDQEHLVVRCYVCGYERLMAVDVATLGSQSAERSSTGDEV